ncbi:MAG TPA: hypothetical protein VGL05_17055 [Kribbella sp.]
MRTEQDLRDAFDELADSAPDAGDIRAALHNGAPRPAFRRTALVIGTAIATAAAAVAAVVVPHVISSVVPVADHQKQPSAWSSWAGVPAIEGIDITMQTYTADRQDYELLLNYSPWVDACELQLRRNGDFDPKTVPAGSPTLKLGDRTAQVVTWPRAEPFPAAPRGYIMPMFAAPVGKTLVWQPAKDVWGLLTCESQRHLGTVKVPTIDAPYDANTALAAKLAVTLDGSSSALRSPFRIGELPADLTARRVTFQPDRRGIDGDGNGLTVTLGDGNPTTGYQPAKKPTVSTAKGDKVGAGIEGGNPAYDLQTGDDLSIRYSTDKFWNSYTRMGTKPVATIHGMKAYFVLDQSLGVNTSSPAKDKDHLAERNVLRLEGDGVSVEIRSLGNQLTHDQLIRIAEGLQLTDHPKDPGSWFDAATAIR